MSRTKLGKIGMTPKGEYDSTTEYKRLDIVTHDGCSYMCLKDCVGIDVANEEYWQLVAEKGKFTEQDKEEFKQAVVEDSKTEINEHTEEKKTELNNYTVEQETNLKNELDTYTETKQTELDTKKTDLEIEMSNKKDSLIEEIENAQNGFNTNAETKTQEFNNNVTAKTTAFNKSVTEETNTFNSNVETKTTEFNDNSTAKLEEYNNNATEEINTFNLTVEKKKAEFNQNAESYEKRIAQLEQENKELVEQMPWRATEISDSIHVEDAAKYSKNRLSLCGNFTETLTDIMQEKSVNNPATISTTTGVQRIRKTKKNIVDVSDLKVGFFTITQDEIKYNTNVANSRTIILPTKPFANKKMSASSDGDRCNIAYCDKKEVLMNDVGYKHSTTNYQNNTRTFTVDNSHEYFAIQFSYAVVPTWIQLEISETNTEKEDFAGEDIILDLKDTKLAKITDENGNTVAQDRIVKRNVDGILRWQFEKNIAKEIIDKSKLKQESTSDSNKKRYSCVLNKNSKDVYLGKNSAYCNVFKLVANQRTYMCEHGFTISEAQNKFFVYNEGETLEDFILKVERIDIVVYYPLLNAEYIDCTEEQSAVLDKLYNLSLERGVNNIFIESENGVTAELQLEYMQDNNLLREQEHKEFEDRITALEAMVVSNATEEV